MPEEVLAQARDELLDWHGSGMSVMEMSHRGEHFMAIHAQAVADLRELLAIPDNYKVLFLQGGGTLQFAMVPCNLLRGKRSAAYVQTGVWSEKAIREARLFCDVSVVSSSEDRRHTYVPPQSAWKQFDDAAYLYYCSNETINGVEFNWVPDTGEVQIEGADVADAAQVVTFFRNGFTRANSGSSLMARNGSSRRIHEDERADVHRNGGSFPIFRCKERRCIRNRRAASEILPPQSVSTRFRYSHSTRSSEGTSSGAFVAGLSPNKARAQTSALVGFVR